MNKLKSITITTPFKKFYGAKTLEQMERIALFGLAKIVKSKVESRSLRKNDKGNDWRTLTYQASVGYVGIQLLVKKWPGNTKFSKEIDEFINEVDEERAQQKKARQ